METHPLAMKSKVQINLLTQWLGYIIHIIPYHILSYHIISHITILYHIISYMCPQWLDMVAGQQLEEISSAYDAYGGGEEGTV